MRPKILAVLLRICRIVKTKKIRSVKVVLSKGISYSIAVMPQEILKYFFILF